VSLQLTAHGEVPVSLAPILPADQEYLSQTQCSGDVKAGYATSAASRAILSGRRIRQLARRLLLASRPASQMP
jgi:hypothetical protein